VQTLNLILLTSAELFELRALVKNSLVTPKGRDLFVDLFKSWCEAQRGARLARRTRVVRVGATIQWPPSASAS
jgi:hypothetical protein